MLYNILQITMLRAGKAQGTPGGLSYCNERAIKPKQKL